jgi:hypothetical protein
MAGQGSKIVVHVAEYSYAIDFAIDLMIAVDY